MIPPILSLEEVLERNKEWIVLSEWRNDGAALVRKRHRKMVADNMAMREKLHAELAGDEFAQAVERRRCAEDFVYWVTRYCTIFNSAERVTIPLLPWETQVREILYPLYHDQRKPLDPEDPSGDKRHHILDKPRYMGVSFCVLAGIVWLSLFHQEWDGGTPCTSLLAADKKEHLYAPDDFETHFGRMEKMVRDLPEWMLPEPIKETGKNATFAAFKIAFKANQSVIRGKAAKKSFGRAQRARIALLDEEAYMEDGHETVTSAGDLTACLWRVSSVNGMTNSHAKAMHDKHLEITRHEIRYDDCPWYDKDWLEKQRVSRSKEAFEREILCNYRVHEGGVYWCPPFSRKINLVRSVELDPMAPLYVAIDIGRKDGTSIIYGQTSIEQRCHFILGHVYRQYATMPYLMPFILGKFPEKNRLGDPGEERSGYHPEAQQFVDYLGRLFSQVRRVFYVVGSDAAQKRVNSDSFVRDARRLWGVNVRPVRLMDKLEAIARVTTMVPYIRIPDFANEATPGQDNLREQSFTISEVFEEYRKKRNAHTGEILNEGLPVHDKYSNPADAIQYWAQMTPMLAPGFTDSERARGLHEQFRNRTTLDEDFAVASRSALDIYGGL